jgi:hypothetical protein
MFVIMYYYIINNYTTIMAKVCFITAIYGNYESSCKKYVPQTIATDFICFTDNPTIVSNGWIIDTIPYHRTCKSELDNNTYINSLCNNKHTFNIAKYYKQAFQNIPRLQSYDVIIWLDGTIEIRASWTVTEQLGLHVAAWGDLLCQAAGLQPLPTGMSRIKKAR